MFSRYYCQVSNYLHQLNLHILDAILQFIEKRKIFFNMNINMLIKFMIINNTSLLVEKYFRFVIKNLLLSKVYLTTTIPS